MKRVLFALVLGGALGMAAGAAAQSSGEDDGRLLEARGLFEQGEAHYEAGRYVLAAEAFQQAFEILTEQNHPRAAMVLINIGASLEEIAGREQEALDAYRRFLEEASPDNSAAQEQVSRVRGRILELEARQQGLRESEGGGGDGDDEGEPRDPIEGGASISPVGPIVLGVGGAALVAGVIAGAFSLGLDSDFRNACDDLSMCPTELRPQYDEMRAVSTAADVLLVAGGIVAAAGLVLTFTLTEGDSPPPVSAACTDDGCVAVVRGGF